MDKTQDAGEGAAAQATCALSFLLPTYRTPLLTGEMLHAAASCGAFAGCQFVLLLDLSDPHILAYRSLVESVREKGLSAGFFIFDGTPYCGMVNRVAPILNVDFLCALDSRHMPCVSGGDVAKAVAEWAMSSAQQMRVGTWNEEGCYPLVSRKLVERLGYMFHPLCYGRDGAETWLLSVAGRLGLVSQVPGGKILESSADGVEIVGMEDGADAAWAADTLAQIADEEAERLAGYLVN